MYICKHIQIVLHKQVLPDLRKLRECGTSGRRKLMALNPAKYRTTGGRCDVKVGCPSRSALVQPTLLPRWRPPPPQAAPESAAKSPAPPAAAPSAAASPAATRSWGRPASRSRRLRRFCAAEAAADPARARRRRAAADSTSGGGRSGVHIRD